VLHGEVTSDEMDTVCIGVGLVGAITIFVITGIAEVTVRVAMPSEVTEQEPLVTIQRYLYPFIPIGGFVIISDAVVHPE
jgi:hypothetical protein